MQSIYLPTKKIQKKEKRWVFSSLWFQFCAKHWIFLVLNWLCLMIFWIMLQVFWVVRGAGLNLPIISQRLRWISQIPWLFCLLKNKSSISFLKRVIEFDIKWVNYYSFCFFGFDFNWLIQVLVDYNNKPLV